MKKHLSIVTVAVAVLLLASCSSSDLGGIFGPQSSSYPAATSDVYGTVNSVDTRNQRIDLTDDYGRSQSIYYDSRTRVSYRNQTGSPSQLERGDRVTIHMINSGNGTVADTINVTQSVSESSTYPGTYPSSTYPGSTSGVRVTGTVNYVDTTNHLINVNANYITGLRNSTSNGSFTIYYDSRTRVMYQGRQFSVQDLERGDQIDVSTFNSGNGQYLADTITVTRNVRQ